MCAPSAGLAPVIFPAPVQWPGSGPNGYPFLRKERAQSLECGKYRRDRVPSQASWRRQIAFQQNLVVVELGFGQELERVGELEEVGFAGFEVVHT